MIAPAPNEALIAPTATALAPANAVVAIAISAVSCIASPTPVAARYRSMSDMPAAKAVSSVPLEKMAMPICSTALRLKRARR